MQVAESEDNDVEYIAAVLYCVLYSEEAIMIVVGPRRLRWPL